VRDATVGDSGPSSLSMSLVEVVSVKAYRVE